MLLLLSTLSAVAGPPQAGADEAGAEAPVPTDPSPGQQCAGAAGGAELEVCLKLAGAHPEAVDGILAAVRSHVDRAGAPDRALLDGVLLLMSEDRAMDGVRRLAELGDARAVGPLLYRARGSDALVAAEATRALALFGETTGPLTELLADEQLPLPVRLAAVDALAQVRSDDAADAMLTALRQRGLPVELHDAITARIQADFPGRAPELQGMVQRDGTAWLASGSAFGMGYALAAAGTLADLDLTVLGGATGVVAGGTLGVILGQARPMEAGDAAFVSTSGTMGSIGGHLVGRAIFPSNRRDAGWTGGLAGSTLGYGLGWGLKGRHQGTAGDSAEAAAFAAATGLALGTGATYLANGASFGGRVDSVDLAAGLGVLGGGAAGHLLAPHFQVSAADVGLMAMGGTYGLLMGTVLPVSERDRAGLQLTGAGLGTVVGYAVGGPLELSPQVSLGAVGGLGYGMAFGAGAGSLLHPGETRTMGTGAAIFGTAGMLSGGALAWRRHEPLQADNAVLTSLATGWALWQMAGWYDALNLNPQRIGLLALVPATTGQATAIISPYVDVTPGQSLSAVSMGMWGGYVGGVTATAIDDSKTLTWALVGSDVGLLGGAVLMSPLVGASPVVVGMADAGGALGGSLLAAGTAAFTDAPEPVVAASLVGAAGGALGGAVLGTVVRKRGGARDVASLDRDLQWAATPAVLVDPDGEAAWGAQLQVVGW